MRAAERDTLVRLEQEVTTRDGRTNEEKLTWAPVREMWVSLLDVLATSDEAIQQGISMAERPAKVQTEYDLAMTQKMRFVVLDQADRILSIVSGPVMIGRRDAMEWMTKTYSTEGQGG